MERIVLTYENIDRMVDRLYDIISNNIPYKTRWFYNLGMNKVKQYISNNEVATINSNNYTVYSMLNIIEDNFSVGYYSDELIIINYNGIYQYNLSIGDIIHISDNEIIINSLYNANFMNKQSVHIVFSNSLPEKYELDVLGDFKFSKIPNYSFE